MSIPLMPKATAVWLIENTALTFRQISEFCGLHILEIEALASKQLDPELKPIDPVLSGQLTLEEIDKCTQDPTKSLVLSDNVDKLLPKRLLNSNKYTPFNKRNDRPNAILWLLKNHPEISDSQIIKLLSTTRNMIQSIRAKTYHNFANLKPRSPVQFEFCTQKEFDSLVSRAIKKQQEISNK